jgi:hypothetical protein
MPMTEALAALTRALEEAGDDPVLVVDFDETLWLRNSTEEYLKSLRPAFLAVLILGLIDLLRPWLILPGHDRRQVYRDWIRVSVTSLLMPWSRLLWQSRARDLGPRWANKDLVKLLRSRPDLRIHVATLGFKEIVEPLLRRMAPEIPLCASDRLWSFHRIRTRGKQAWVEAALGRARLARAIVVTDSEEDTDLLAGCAKPFLIRWPEARYEPAFSHHYLPFAYTERGKRTGQRYLLQHVLMEDALLLCIASAWLMPQPILGAVSLVILHLSFWLIYEIGYAENDLVATKREARPNLPPDAVEQARRMHSGMAWLTALLWSGPALLLLVITNDAALPFLSGDESLGVAFASASVIWIAYLVACRLTYWVYNRIDTVSRSLLYPLLQLFRTAGYAVLVPVNLLGIKLLLSVVLARWLPYLTYRFMGQHWPGPGRLLILGIFLLLSFGGVMVEPAVFLSLQFAVAAGWLAARAHKPIRSMVVSAGFRSS